MSEDSLRVLGIAGSLRVNSYNKALLRAAIELAPSSMEIRSYEIDAVPLYNGDVEERGDPEPVVALKAAIREADALLIATPEYNYGVPGVLKNAIDWASRAPSGERQVLKGKPVAIMGASPGVGGTIRAQLQLRQAFVFTQSYALAAPEVAVSRAHEKFDATGRLTDEPTREYVRKLLVRLADWAPRIRGIA